jgi:hypothetical protein
MTASEAGKVLEAAGIGFYVGYPGGGMAGIDPADMDTYASDPASYWVRELKITPEEFAERERTEWGRLCAAYTLKGTPCPRGSWNGRGGRCKQHAEPEPAHA